MSVYQFHNYLLNELASSLREESHKALMLKSNDGKILRDNRQAPVQSYIHVIEVKTVQGYHSINVRSQEKRSVFLIATTESLPKGARET